ncbi:2-oxoglutarate dehydrogenase complex dihydrolipoyllysine-residue succinyltransferase [Anaerolineae bacterium CFX7]|nr:2-oxoglutarate dehydrogenase complex dihydrolipoyllysine-residue succinyltransferase [Anaerolineae bacterium CFX7]
MSIQITVPELGESVVEATVLRWHKTEGATVTAGEPLVELETEKVNLDVSAPRDGVLARIEHQAGDDVKIGDVLGILEPTTEGASSATPPPTPAEPSPPTPTVTPPTKTVAPPMPSAVEFKATPVAERMAHEYGVDLRQVAQQTGSAQIGKQQVEKFIKNRQASPPRAAPQAADATQETRALSPRPAPAPRAPSVEADDARQERRKMSRRRQTIARRLVEAQRTAAMLTTFNEVDMSAVMTIRKQRREDFEKRHGVRLGLSSFFVRAVVGALKAFPNLNAEIQGDQVVYKNYYDIGIAVDAGEGLVVPVLRDADRLTFADIESKVRDFGERAAQGTLTLEDLRGGTFTLTNGGVFGSLLSTPILNPPQVGILGLHKIEERPIAFEGQVVIRPMMYIALTYDHRLVDGRDAVRFLVRVKELVQDPVTLLLDL